MNNTSKKNNGEIQKSICIHFHFSFFPNIYFIFLNEKKNFSQKILQFFLFFLSYVIKCCLLTVPDCVPILSGKTLRSEGLESCGYGTNKISKKWLLFFINFASAHNFFEWQKKSWAKSAIDVNESCCKGNYVLFYEP